MSIGSISFWQQDRLYWSQAAARDQSLANSDQVISTLGAAMTSLSSGLASVANQTALNRVNTELSAAVQSALKGASSGTGGTSGPSSSSNSSSSSSAASSSSASSGSSAASAAPATGTGATPLATNTSLFTLGIVKKGTITVSDGTNTTTYTSTGNDTVGDLINTINIDGKAKVTALLNSSGELVLTADSNAATITVGGLYAANIGFGVGNNTFQPTAATSTTASATSSSGSFGSSNAATGSASSGQSGTNASSTGASTQQSSGALLNSAFALQTVGTAETLLSSNGLAGSLLNMLA